MCSLILKCQRHPDKRVIHLYYVNELFIWFSNQSTKSRHVGKNMFLNLNMAENSKGCASGADEELCNICCFSTDLIA